MFTFVGNHQTILHSGRDYLHSHQPWMRVPCLPMFSKAAFGVVSGLNSHHSNNCAIVSSLDYAFGVVSKKSSPYPRSFGFFPVLSSGHIFHFLIRKFRTEKEWLYPSLSSWGREGQNLSPESSYGAFPTAYLADSASFLQFNLQFFGFFLTQQYFSGHMAFYCHCSVGSLKLLDLVSYPISYAMKKVAGVNACNTVSSRSLVNTKGPSSSSFREQCPQSPQFFKKGYLAHIEDLLPESACIQCLVDVDAMPDLTPTLHSLPGHLRFWAAPAGSTDALSKLPSSPASPSAQSCFWTLFSPQVSAQDQSGIDFCILLSVSHLLLGTQPMTVGAGEWFEKQNLRWEFGSGSLPLSWQWGFPALTTRQCPAQNSSALINI